MVRDDRAGFIARLRCVPILDLVVEAVFQRCVELEILGGLFDVFGPVLITKTNQPFPVFWDAAYFFGKTRVKISSTTWMMLLERSGESAMISEAAARPMAIIAVVTGSMEINHLQNYSSDPALAPLSVFRDRQVFLYGLTVVL